MDNIETFKCDVKQFDIIDAEIKELSEKVKPLHSRIKELKSRKSELQGNICEYMATNDIDECNTKNGKIVYKETKSVKPLTQTDIKESIRSFLADVTPEYTEANSSQKAEMLIEFIYDVNRETTVKAGIKKK